MAEYKNAALKFIWHNHNTAQLHIMKPFHIQAIKIFTPCHAIIYYIPSFLQENKNYAEFQNSF